MALTFDYLFTHHTLDHFFLQVPIRNRNRISPCTCSCILGLLVTQGRKWDNRLGGEIMNVYDNVFFRVQFHWFIFIFWFPSLLSFIQDIPVFSLCGNQPTGSGKVTASWRAGEPILQPLLYVYMLAPKRGQGLHYQYACKFTDNLVYTSRLTTQENDLHPHDLLALSILRLYYLKGVCSVNSPEC